MHNHSVLFVLLLAVGVSPWCLLGRLNLTSAIDRVDFSHDGLLIAATSSTANEVAIYETLTFEKIYTYTPSVDVAHVARFSRATPGHLVVGKWNGDIDILTLTRNPFTATFLDSYDAQGNDATSAVTDMDFNYDNTKVVTCGTNDDDVIAIAGWATPGARV